MSNLYYISCQPSISISPLAIGPRADKLSFGLLLNVIQIFPCNIFYLLKDTGFFLQVSIVMMVICIDKTLLRIIDMIGSTILWNILDTIWNFLIILIGILIMSGCDGW